MLTGVLVLGGRRSASFCRRPFGFHEHGPAALLPEVVVAPPAGVGGELTTYSVPIEGRAEWIAAAEGRSA